MTVVQVGNVMFLPSSAGSSRQFAVDSVQFQKVCSVKVAESDRGAVQRFCLSRSFELSFLFRARDVPPRVSGIRASELMRSFWCGEDNSSLCREIAFVYSADMSLDVERVREVLRSSASVTVRRAKIAKRACRFVIDVDLQSCTSEVAASKMAGIAASMRHCSFAAVVGLESLSRKAESHNESCTALGQEAISYIDEKVYS